MTYKILLIGINEVLTNLKGLNVKIDSTGWEYIKPLQKYEMVIVDNSSINANTVRIAIKAKEDFLDFIKNGGLLVCLSSRQKNYGGYKSYAWLPCLSSLKLKISKLETQSLKIKRTRYKLFIENQKENISIECYFSNIQETEDTRVIATTGLDEVIAFSMNIGKGMVVCIPQFKDKILFLKNWLPFWISEKPEWLEKFQYKVKEELSKKLKKINIVEKLLYGNSRELRNAVIEAFKILGFDAKPAGRGTEQDINLSYNSFVGIVEVKGLKSHADRDDMRALLDYYDANVKNQPNLKGIFVVNHYRNIEPGKKEKPYTDSALELAQRKKFCLLTTEDLYFTIEKVFEEPELQNAIRQKIIQGQGLVRL